MASDGLRNILMLVAYDGADFSGWQRLPGRRTVQGTLEEILSLAAGLGVNVTGSGRTDAGVHAQAQAANVRLPAGIELEELGPLLADRMPADLGIASARLVHPSFHARYRALEKTYAYRLAFQAGVPCSQRLNRPMPSVAELSRLADACRLFEGTHRFRAFTNAKADPLDFIRTVSETYVLAGPGYVDLVFRADGFMFNQVRLMASAAWASLAGRTGRGGQVDIRLLVERGERAEAPGALPARGLRLVSVRYREEDYRSDPVAVCPTGLPFRR